MDDPMQRDVQDESLKNQWLYVFVFFALLYGFTAQRGVSWQDNGEYQWRSWNGQIVSQEYGLCRSHPLYMTIGYGISKLPLPFPMSLNIFSAVMGAVAVANFSMLSRFFTKKSFLILGLTFCLGLSHTLWWLSTITETYTTHLAIFTFELLFLFRYIKTGRPSNLYWLALFNGLGISVHNLALLSIPVYAGVVIYMLSKRQTNFRHIFSAGLFWAAGLSPLIAASAFKLSGEPMGFGELVMDILVGGYGDEVFNVAGVTKFALPNAFFSSLNFANLLAIFALAGIVALLKNFRRAGLLRKTLVFLTTVHFLFYIRYSVPDQFMFILPSLVLIGLCSANAFEFFKVPRKIQDRLCYLLLAFAVLQPLVFSGVCSFAQRHELAKRERTIDRRNEARYWIKPWKNNERSAQLWSEAVVELVPQGSVLIADNSSRYALFFARERSGKDITVIHGAPEKFDREEAYFSVTQIKSSPEHREWQKIRSFPRLYELK
ncbi:protein O-mannosyl-transferase family [Sedimentisphaera salicampi]|uniref:Glycosyltransferase RgtA/B/C/D-like domain-containing protein n=1 Tax=Sedimentisphaera salicampi TaxID=1941349 RepID=A0A1W6LPW6_9BACT|nr:DUF2723 domain-containing protein [Sedimentisphaera salicampi]ARN57820.1 hypothetical protein STSP1_02246 [Sedimentisphaera salicampi]